MRVAPIPDWLTQLFADDHERRIFAAPNGSLIDDNIRPAEALVGRTQFADGTWPTLRMVAVLEPGDAERLQHGGVIMLTLLANGLPPFDLQVVAPGDAR